MKKSIVAVVAVLALFFSFVSVFAAEKVYKALKDGRVVVEEVPEMPRVLQGAEDLACRTGKPQIANLIKTTYETESFFYVVPVNEYGSLIKCDGGILRKIAKKTIICSEKEISQCVIAELCFIFAAIIFVGISAYTYFVKKYELGAIVIISFVASCFVGILSFFALFMAAIMHLPQTWQPFLILIYTGVAFLAPIILYESNKKDTISKVCFVLSFIDGILLMAYLVFLSVYAPV